MSHSTFKPLVLKNFVASQTSPAYRLGIPIKLIKIIIYNLFYSEIGLFTQVTIHALTTFYFYENLEYNIRYPL